MRYIRTNHNPLTVSDILLKNGTARLEDFYPLTKVKTASDKEALLSQGYHPGYTVSEWPYALPADKIYYSKHLTPSTYYYDPDNEVIPIAQPFGFTFFRFIMAASTRKILIFRAINR